MKTPPLFLAFSLLLMATFQPALAASEAKAASSHFLSLADIHFDPFLSCLRQIPCPLIASLEQAPIQQWSGILAQYDHTQTRYSKDSNYSLLKSALAAAQKAAQEEKPEFVVLMGDYLAHDFDLKYRRYSQHRSPKDYQRFVNKTLAFISEEIHQSFPGLPLYFVVGNNDSYTVDYGSDDSGQFFKDSGKLWSPFSGSAQDQKKLDAQFAKGGYYALNAPGNDQLRLIFLNSVLFSKKAVGKNTPQLAKAQLAWLNQELAAATQAKQQAFIFMHIPTGIDVYASFLFPFSLVEFWKPEYTQPFLSEVKDHSSNLSGIFSGHLHADTLQILNNGYYNEVPAIGTPSISPIFGNNPGFKIFSYYRASGRLRNYSTYFYSMNDKTWSKEYDFREVYQKQGGQEALIAAIKRIEREGDLAKHYQIYYALGGSQPITQDAKWNPFYWCAMHWSTANEYQRCLNQGGPRPGFGLTTLHL